MMPVLLDRSIFGFPAAFGRGDGKSTCGWAGWSEGMGLSAGDNAVAAGSIPEGRILTASIQAVWDTSWLNARSREQARCI
jgi:hypothetical protein